MVTLNRLVADHANVTQVDATYGPSLPPPTGATTICAWANQWRQQREVQAKCSKWPLTRVYLTRGSEFFYVVYFDASNRVQDVTLVEN